MRGMEGFWKVESNRRRNSMADVNCIKLFMTSGP